MELSRQERVRLGELIRGWLGHLSGFGAAFIVDLGNEAVALEEYGTIAPDLEALARTVAEQNRPGEGIQRRVLDTSTTGAMLLLWSSTKAKSYALCVVVADATYEITAATQLARAAEALSLEPIEAPNPPPGSSPAGSGAPAFAGLAQYTPRKKN